MSPPNPRARKLVLTACAIVSWPAFATTTSWAQPTAAQPSAAQPGDQAPLDDVPIDVSLLSDADTARIAGSAHRVSAKELERFEDDNVERTLGRIPGVYARGEDGYGLRPNIGLRGASSDRTKKVTLLEDGILMAPAPYSSPAAYYFPMPTRAAALEVFKGPSALRYGPQTIGGAVNFVTRPIPWGHRFGADLALGQELYAKSHAHYGYGEKHAGWLVEAGRLRSDGFKQQEGARPLPESNTGFDKFEAMTKARVNTDPDAAIYNELRGKLGYSHEVSNETYLGLTDADFRASPMRRYAASALDQMRYHRSLAEVTHALVIANRLELRTTYYRHELKRVWHRLDAFAGASLADVLAAPTSGQRAVYYAILKGEQDSVSSDQQLFIVNNDRRFVSEGIESVASIALPALNLWATGSAEAGVLRQELGLGLRIHRDSADRTQTRERYRMRSARLERSGAPDETTELSVAGSRAFAGWIVDEISLGRLTVAPGLRVELVETEEEDRLAGTVTEGVQRAILPGVGAFFAIDDALGVLAGVHQGWSPVTPGQPDHVKPEVAVNYELGARYHQAHTSLELIGFVSDYQNLTGDCAASSGCSEAKLDAQFNGGHVLVGGLEFAAGTALALPHALRLPMRSSYTFTASRFLTSFASENPSWGNVEVGDALPYVPAHQLAVTVGLEHAERAGVDVGVTFVDSMREHAGSGTASDTERTDAHAVLDAAMHWQATKALRLYGKAENLLDAEYLTSRRPFGARPGRPRFLYVGAKLELW
ncbi:MAG: TonB-dependent receptor [Myxococcales bacterium]|nr:TonB-dependent receptor [Myxococcales bacterium]